MIYWKTTIPKDLEEIGNLELNRFSRKKKVENIVKLTITPSRPIHVSDIVFIS